jgi:5-methylcytosine-specific restriction protein A
VAPAPLHQRRRSASQRGYGARRRRLRWHILARHPRCADPFGHHRADGRVVAASVVDHIIARRGGGTDALANLQPLCQVCHRRKTVLYDGGLGRARRFMRPHDMTENGMALCLM